MILPLALCYLVVGPFVLFVPFVVIVVQSARVWRRVTDRAASSDVSRSQVYVIIDLSTFGFILTQPKRDRL